jgi:hypothetical protein
MVENMSSRYALYSTSQLWQCIHAIHQNPDKTLTKKQRTKKYKKIKIKSQNRPVFQGEKRNKRNQMQKGIAIINYRKGVRDLVTRETNERRSGERMRSICERLLLIERCKMSRGSCAVPSTTLSRYRGH